MEAKISLPDTSAMNSGQPKKQRQRAAHRKSRSGCTSCKKRRVRCGEEQPACLSCLVHGTDCVYSTNSPSSVPDDRPKEAPAEDARSLLLTILSGAPADPFDVLPVKMTYRSSEAFHQFMIVRALLGDVFPTELKGFRSNLGLAETNPLWFQTTLCVTASYRGLQNHPNFGQTYLYHRQGLLKWLGQNLDKAGGTVPAAYISVIGAMIITDSASGDDDSVEAHLQGALALLETRKHRIGGWQFFDALAKRMLLMSLCFTFTIRQTKARSTCSSQVPNPIIASMYTHLANECFRAPFLTGKPDATRRSDGPILAWLEKALKERRRVKLWGESSWDRAERGAHSSKEQQYWLKAVSAYALTVGTMDWLGADRGISKELKELRAEWSELVEDWVATEKYMTQNIAKRVWQKMQWLESDAGLEVVRELASLAESDSVYQSRDALMKSSTDKELGAAPGLIIV